MRKSRWKFVIAGLLIPVLMFANGWLLNKLPFTLGQEALISVLVYVTGVYFIYRFATK